MYNYNREHNLKRRDHDVVVENPDFIVESAVLLVLGE